MQQGSTFSNYLSLIKFSHTIFALPFAIIGYFLAITSTDAVFDIRLFALVILCMVFARSAAMAFQSIH
jgi:4-hydroxybenzoate polyprenyltransferase